MKKKTIPENHLDNDKEEQRREPDWQWLEELLSEYNITEKRTGTTPKRDFTGIEARLYREIQKRYRQRKKPDYIKTPTANRSSKQYEDAKRIHGEQVKTMDAMGYGLMLDGFAFYKYGHELEPYDFEQNFQMHQAYEIHSFTQSKLKAFAREFEKAIENLERGEPYRYHKGGAHGEEVTKFWQNRKKKSEYKKLNSNLRGNRHV